ncbi:unnamed protein product [Orchesella dallaii]|uniref:Peptidase S54 rhomboid domain-containing protein n=1 Tax=Orchesella dallaii TaxID=48710 RepID=A0ABP1QY39_9HEXA
MPRNRVSINRDRVNVEVLVNRNLSSLKDINNNKGRVLGPAPFLPEIRKANMHMSTYIDLPPISTFFSLLMIGLYLFHQLLNIKEEEDVCVSWKTVVTDGEVWRILYAQFFHFVRVIIFFNVITLMSIGRYLEKKIQQSALVILIILMSALSNLMYLFFADWLCSGPTTEYTVGFSTTMFSLRMIHIFTMDHESHNGRGDPSLIFGFLPIHLPMLLSPWQPLMETIFFEVAIFGRCVASNISGICAGLIFPYLMKHFRHLIMLPRSPPPAPPRQRTRNTISLTASDSEENNNHHEEYDNNNEYND